MIEEDSVSAETPLKDNFATIWVRNQKETKYDIINDKVGKLKNLKREGRNRTRSNKNCGIYEPAEGGILGDIKKVVPGL